MKKIYKILLIFILIFYPTLSFSQRREVSFDDGKTSVELTINGSKIVVQNLPQEGLVEIFNILGSKMMSFNVRGGANVNRINLPEGYYILRSDNVTKKIVVR